MRLDLFLKWSRIIARRTLARETCDAGRVSVNGKEARAGRELRPGDVVSIDLPRRHLKVRVREAPAHPPSKAASAGLIEILEDRRLSDAPCS